MNHVSPKADRKATPGPNSSIDTPTCVICTKSLILFDSARAHVSFEPSLRNTPQHEWSLSWKVDASDPKIYPQVILPHNPVSVKINVSHKGGYGWGIGESTTSNKPFNRDQGLISRQGALKSTQI